MVTRRPQHQPQGYSQPLQPRQSLMMGMLLWRQASSNRLLGWEGAALELLPVATALEGVVQLAQDAGFMAGASGPRPAPVQQQRAGRTRQG